jgi:NCS1 family nucleobase:cation symporter-1
VFGLGLWASFVALILGALMGSVMIPIMSKMGWKLGIPQMIMTRPVFGRVGAILPVIIAWVNFLGWFTILDVLGAKALSLAFGLPIVAGIIVVSALAILLGIYGNDMIHASEKWIAILAGIVFIIIAIMAVPHVDWSYAGDSKLTGANWWGVFVLVVAIAFSYAGPGYTPYASDYTRYLPKDIPFRKIFTPTFLGMGLSCIVVFCLGAAVLSSKPDGDVLQLVSDMLGPFSKVAMVALALGSIAGNAMNVYSGGLTALVSGIKVNRWVSALGIGIVGTILGLWMKEDFPAKFENYLLLILYLIPAMDAIFITDFFFVRKGKYQMRDLYGTDSPMFNAPGWIAYIIGVLVCIPLMSSALYTGSVATYLHGADISYLVSMIVAGLCYWGIKKFTAQPVKPTFAESPAAQDL